MEEIVLRAKVILSALFNIEEVHFEKHTSRNCDVISARGYLIFFLRNDIGMTYNQILNYIPALTNHATIMHNFKRMSSLLDVENDTKLKYLNFKNRMIDNKMYVIETEIMKKVKERNIINLELTKLKKLL
tara:strand:+ start:101 stop:490 length:390 start_codon:yes stop_codon:yes gene_type:complete